MKQYHVQIYFDKTENNHFGALQHQATTLLLKKDVKDELISHFLAGETVVAVTMSDNSTRYINTRNILYIDVTEILEEQHEEK